MRNFKTAVKAVDDAEKGMANNSARRENAKYMDSIEGKLASLKSAWSSFSNTMLKSDTIKNVLSMLTAGLRVLSSDAGQAAIKFGAFTLAGVGIFKIFKKIKPAGVLLIDTFKILGSSSAAFVKAGGDIAGANGKLIHSFTNLSKSAKAFASTFASTTTFAVGLPVALALASVALAKYVKIGSSKEASDIDKNLKKTNDELDKLKGKYKSLYDEREQLKKKKADIGLDKGEETRLKYLEAETRELRRQIELKAQLKAEQTTEAYRKVDPSKLTGSMKKSYTAAKASGQSDKAALMSAGAYNDLDVAAHKYTDTTLKLAEAVDRYNEARKKTNKAEKEYGKDSEQYLKASKAEINAYDKQDTLSKKVGKSLEKLKDTREKLYKDYGDEDLFNQNAPQDIKKSERALTKLIKRSEKMKKIQEGTADVSKTFKQLGRDIGLSDNKLDLKTFQNSLKAVGVGAEDALGYLKQLTKENPDIKVNLEGKDVAVKDLKVIDGEIKKKRQAKVETKADDKASKELGKLKKQNKLGTATKNIKQSGYENVKKKLDNLKGNHSLGTDTKTIVTVKKTQGGGGKKASGTRNFYAKGTDDSASGNAVVNEQGFEIIRDGRTGAMRVANAGQRGSTWLNRGDAVYTHGQSMRMLQRAGLTEADLLQGRNGDVGVFGVSKLEGFAKGKKQTKYNKARDALRATYDAAVETAEFKQERYGYSDDWLHAQMKKARATYLKKLKKLNKQYSGVTKSKGLGTDRERDYILSGVYQTSAEKAVAGIEDALAGFEGGDVKYSKVLEKIKAARKKKLISSQEYKEYLAQLKEIYNEEKKEAISKNIELVANNRKTYDDILAQIKKAYKEGRMSAKEYDEFVAELNEAEVERVRNNYENQWDYISQYVQRQIDLEQKNNDVLEAQGELLSATTQKVKVYKEGVGFVYEADERAVKEAQDNLKSYSSVWEQISEIMDDVESQVNLQRAGVLAGGDLVSQVLGAGTNLSTWQNIIGLIGSNVGAYGLADDLNITDPSKINKATTINGQTFNIDNISLPNVSNANDFVAQLQTLAIQASSSRS